jgi:hypothetical protein
VIPALPTLSDLLDLTPAELLEQADQTAESMRWLSGWRTKTEEAEQRRVRAYLEQLVLSRRIGAAIEIRLATEGVCL